MSRGPWRKPHCRKTNQEYHLQNRVNRLAYKKRYNKTNWPKRKETRKLITQFLWDYKLKHPCKCGEADPILLEFDHVRGTKKFNIANAVQYAMKTVSTEIAKCVVKCVSCHRRKTFMELQLFRNLRPDQYAGGGANG